MATLSKNTSLVNGQPKERNKLRILVSQVAHNKGINFWNAAPVAADDDQRRFAGAAIITMYNSDQKWPESCNRWSSQFGVSAFRYIGWCCNEKKFHVHAFRVYLWTFLVFIVQYEYFGVPVLS